MLASPPNERRSADGFLEWPEHLETLRWAQGEHATLIGPTGCGKTTLAEAVLPERSYVVVFGTKPRSPSLERYAKTGGYRIVRRWEDVGTRRGGDRVILWPRGDRFRFDADEFEARQYEEFRDCLRELYEVGGWTVYVDELSYISEYLSLDRELNRLWLQGREIPVTLVCSMQSPAYVPRYAYDQIQHVYLWRNRDLRRVKTLTELSGATDRDAVETSLNALRRHEVLYVGADGQHHRTKVDLERGP